jgi:hypothetical protein
VVLTIVSVAQNIFLSDPERTVLLERMLKARRERKNR